MCYLRMDEYQEEKSIRKSRIDVNNGQEQDSLNLQKQKVLAPHDESVVEAVVNLLRNLLETEQENS